MVPYMIYDLLIGGLMARVIVPFLMRRRTRDSDGGRATEDRPFTSAGLLLFVVTAVAILGAELLIRLYGDRGRHARSAIGTHQLPLDIPVEVELVVRVRD